MSTLIISCAHELHEHILQGQFTEAAQLIRRTQTSNNIQRDACRQVLHALTKADSGPARDNGFGALFALLIELGDAEQAFAVTDAIGKNSHLASRRDEFRQEVDKLVARSQEALRQQ